MLIHLINLYWTVELMLLSLSRPCQFEWRLCCLSLLVVGNLSVRPSGSSASKRAPPIAVIVVPHILIVQVVSSEGRFGKTHAVGNPVWVSHSNLHAIQLRAMKASDCFITILLFCIIHEGASSGGQNLHAMDDPDLLK